MKKKNFIPKQQVSNEGIPSSRELNKFREFTQYVCEAKEKGYVIESFLVAYQIIQEMELPRLKKLILQKLGLNKLIKDLSIERNPYVSNLNYLALSQDVELYILLEKARKIRNELSHKLTNFNNIKEPKEIARKALKDIIMNLFRAIQDRWNGDVAIPILTLYPKGWND